ncbi:cache domain-containing protein [Undibacterium aquatile]|jgi:signal transduction histidine kinase|uniref:Cache domain-containing protein n=1 Tax=Undibacterium aquatile TaxID=1537398 RepID=A0ABR6XHR2_9BURK|nr:cache domain-containing protein [Undibacterium aquatile]MBC3812450.1 cache domain-containing protein [Undibacterium aquatile]MBY0570634.1 cache domain-containing protein [Burkholderiaceae bacterium]
MRAILKFFTFAFFSLFISQSVMAAEHGTQQEAEALVKKAIAYLKANGQEKALAEFNNPKGSFVDRDLYIWVTELNGKALAHGANARLVGKDLRSLRDVDNKAFVEEVLAGVATKGKGWVDYKWPNPTTKAIEQKSTYYEKAGDLVFACGVYK